MENLLLQIDTWIADMKYDLSRDNNSEQNKYEAMLQILRLEEARDLLKRVGPNDNIPQNLIIERA